MDGEQLCVCGHERYFHWYRGGQERIVERKYQLQQWGVMGKLANPGMPIREFAPYHRAECAWSWCECGAFQSGEKYSARKVSHG